MVSTTSAIASPRRDRGSSLVAAALAGIVNLVAVFALVAGLWFVLLHPNGVFALYTPMYGFSLVVAFVAAIVILAKLAEFYPLQSVAWPDPVRGAVLTGIAAVMAFLIVRVFFWHFIGRLGITYFSPYSIVAAGGVGAEFFNARENASTAIIYVLAAFLWIAMVWAVGFGRWPWLNDSAGVRAWSRFASVTLIATIVYVVLFHPHVCALFYPAQTMAGVAPWWAAFAQTASAYFNLGLVLCVVLWIVVSDVLWDRWPWRWLDRDGHPGFLSGAFAFVGTIVLGALTAWIALTVMTAVWMEPFEGGQYTEAPYFRYLHAGEIAGFGMLGAFAARAYLDRPLSRLTPVPACALRTLLAAAIGVAAYLFYYSPAGTGLLGRVPGIGQPEDTPLVWTLLFIAVVLCQREFFRGWPLRMTDTEG
jgi:amino acid transporter, AAT family